MFKGIGPMQGVAVSDEDALAYALEQCGVRQITGDKDNPQFGELLDAIKEWFFSGNFRHYEDSEICQSEPEEDGPDPDEEYERYLNIDPWED